MERELSNRLERSLDKAFGFIERSQNPDGLWSDFLTLAGESTFWVSGYVGYAMSRHDRSQKDGWLEEVALRILDHQHEDGGWGYGPGVPPDADSTSWCLRFLSSIGTKNPESCARASRFLLKHQNQADGGFRTYFSPADVGRYMGLYGSIPFDGWLSSQLCVTAVAVEALAESGYPDGTEKARDLIRKSQTEDGFWNSYWWCERIYATVHCMGALESGKTGDDARLLDRAQEWIAGMQMTDGSWSGYEDDKGVPFWTALALRGLMAGHEPDVSRRIIRGVDWLVSSQLADGSWPSGYMLRIPLPSMKDPWNQPFWSLDGRAINALIRDHRRLFTTATAFAALSEYRETLSGGT